MKVAHINASDQTGGAALAVWRLHQALREHGVDSRLLVQYKTSDDHSVEALTDAFPTDPTLCRRMEVIQRVYSERNRTAITNTHFSLSLLGLDLSQHPTVRDADLIHLHWVASFQTPQTLRSLLTLGKPIVWTLHDLEPFTGGCHFPAGCGEFQASCAPCPQLRSDPFGVPSAVLQDKKGLWSTHALTLLAPSGWIAGRARESALFRSVPRLSVIPNGVDTRVFRSYPQAEARAALGIPREGKYLLCGADHGEEKRKGFDLLGRILSGCLQNPWFKSSFGGLLWVGGEPGAWSRSALPCMSLGRLTQAEHMALAYAAADIFVLSSLEDNLPNMMLEALSCGTPVIAFAVGGIPEVVQDGAHGRLVPPVDEQAMAQGILSLLSDPETLRVMGRRGHALIEERYSYPVIAERHLELYLNVLKANEAQGQTMKATSPPVPPSRPIVMSTDPGPALGALLPNLTLHCLNEDVQRLQQQIPVVADCRAHIDTLHQAAACPELRAKEDVIEHLHQVAEERGRLIEHLHQVAGERGRLIEQLHQVAEERGRLIEQLHQVAEGRGRLIEQLHQVAEEHSVRRPRWIERASGITRRCSHLASHLVLAKVERALRLVRLGHWWYSKIPPLLAVAYLQILRLDLGLGTALSLLGCYLFSIACVAAYGHVINDVFDVHVDQRAGKPNAMASLKWSGQALLCSALVGAGFLPLLIMDSSRWAQRLLLLNYVWPTIYSLPIIRLKERGIWGVLCDAAGSHITPTLLALAVFRSSSPVSSISPMAFPLVISVWACALGIKGILYHQVADRENDVKAAVATFATKAPPDQIERFLPRYNLWVELPISGILALVVFGWCPLAVGSFVIYCVVETLKYKLGFQFALNTNPRNTRASIPFVNELFYTVWLPLAAVVQVAMRGPAWLWLPVLHLVAFTQVFFVQARDLYAVVTTLQQVLRHRYRQWLTDFRWHK